ncbi:MAG: oligosaccharyltransferase complex subunit epsilon [Vezdaea acicularis]|nr:MAG: oligosaccharyltransferase complex subunit epsilon [Vezdaea acicularis]
MAKKSSHNTPSKPTHTQLQPQHPPPTPSTASTTNPLSSLTKSTNPAIADPAAVLQNLWRSYVDKTPQRVKLLDSFMAFLVLSGALQFVYCVLAGNYPFNAFLSGFSATIGQFVLTASLRMQTNPENKKEFGTISNER